MRTVLLFLLAIFVANFGLCQQESTFRGQQQSKVERIFAAETQIVELKKSFLLVRLKTGKSTIEAMLKAGQNEMAEKKQKLIDEENLRIIKSFRTEFDFCPVYFFYSDDSKFVKEKQFEKVNFLNDSLQPDNTVKLNSEKFFIAEWGNVKGDTASYYSHTSYEPDGNFSQGPVYVYYGGGSTDAKGLIVKDCRFYQLRSPFPFFVKNPFFRKREKTEIYTVRELNRKLWDYLAEVKR
jgi:hypothetical protein